MSLINGFSFSQCVAYLGQGVKEFTVMQIYFYIFHFWFLLIILVPILTMRLFSEEYKTGTIEMLLTAPVKDGDVILSKFFGVLFFYLLLWIPSLLGLAIFSSGDASSGAGGVDPAGVLLLDGDVGRDALSIDRFICLGLNAESGGGGNDLLHDDCPSFLCGIPKLSGSGSRLAGCAQLYFYPGADALL